jgi:hypothetical protein
MANKNYIPPITYTNSSNGLYPIGFIDNCIKNAINTWFGQDVVFVVTYTTAGNRLDANIEVRRPDRENGTTEYLTTMTASQYNNAAVNNKPIAIAVQKKEKK